MAGTVGGGHEVTSHAEDALHSPLLDPPRDYQHERSHRYLRVACPPGGVPLPMLDLEPSAVQEVGAF